MKTVYKNVLMQAFDVFWGNKMKKEFMFVKY